jgi:His/Glu/Gln/Arg/opine family amino acid ABC transporter permease subunit
MSYDINLIIQYMPRLLRGITSTASLFAMVMLICTPLSLIVALARVGEIRWLRPVAATYVNVIRALPVLVVLFFTFYGLPAFGVRVTPFIAAMIGLCVATTALLAEDVRAALLAVDSGQYQASEALGLGYWRRTFRIILPQALPVMIAPYFTRAMVSLKATSIASIVAVGELTSESMAIVTETYRAVEFLSFAAAAYLLLSSLLALLQHLIQKKVSLP